MNISTTVKLKYYQISLIATFSHSTVSKLDLPHYIIRQYVRIYSRADINYDAEHCALYTMLHSFS